MLSEIEGYKRSAKQEMIQSEKTMNILYRLETEYNDLLKTLAKNKELVSELEAEYSYFSGIIMQTEKSLQSALMVLYPKLILFIRCAVGGVLLIFGTFLSYTARK